MYRLRSYLASIRKDLKLDFFKHKEESRIGGGRVVWPYFTIFQDSLGNDLEAAPFGKLSVGGPNPEIIINEMEQKEQIEKRKVVNVNTSNKSTKYLDVDFKGKVINCLMYR